MSMIHFFSLVSIFKTWIPLVIMEREGNELCNKEYRSAALILAVLRIRAVYPGSRIRLFFIPDPNFFIPDPPQRI
jgi:hypothetical protein